MDAPTPICIGTIIRHALTFNAQRWHGAALPMDDILQTVADLFALLAQRQTPYVLVGGIAMLQYVQGRNTEDIDLILGGDALPAVPEIVLQREDHSFARGDYQGLQIDLLLTRNPLFAYVQQTHTQPRPFFERTITVATVAGLILLKLYALPSLYRQGEFARVGLDENDIATLTFYHHADLDALLTELAPFVGDQDRDAIAEVVVDVRRRLRRFGRDR